MKRLIFTLAVSVAGFAAIVSFASPDVQADETSVDQSETVPSRATG